jgi:hypothetical protein
MACRAHKQVEKDWSELARHNSMIQAVVRTAVEIYTTQCNTKSIPYQVLSSFMRSDDSVRLNLYNTLRAM